MAESRNLGDLLPLIVDGYVRTRDGARVIGRTGDQRIGRPSGGDDPKVSPDLVGRTYPAVAFDLGRSHVRAFAQAVGHPAQDVPPTIAVVPEFETGLRNVVTDPDLGVDLAHVLHGEQEYEWLRPFAEGERVTAEATIDQLRTRGDVTFLVLRTEVRDVAGATIVRGRCTLIVRAPA
jgi:hypothetical protein